MRLACGFECDDMATTLGELTSDEARSGTDLEHAFAEM
jgi:hypothetical protein